MIRRLRKSKKNFFLSTSKYFIVGSLVVILFFLAVSDFRLFIKKKKTDNEVRILQEKVNNLKNIDRNLKNRLNTFSNKDYVEKVLREKGMYKKPNEEAVVVLPLEKSTSKGTKTKSSSQSFSSKFSFLRIKEMIAKIFKNTRTDL